jgi:hypothetical protein
MRSIGSAMPFCLRSASLLRKWTQEYPVIVHLLTLSSAVLMILHRGPKPAIVAASLFVLAGNWIRYAGAKTASFPALMLGQIIIGFAQPCVLNAPTTYSDLWFTERGRTTATAVATLANPLGGAVSHCMMWQCENIDC